MAVQVRTEQSSRISFRGVGLSAAGFTHGRMKTNAVNNLFPATKNTRSHKKMTSSQHSFPWIFVLFVAIQYWDRGSFMALVENLPD